MYLLYYLILLSVLSCQYNGLPIKPLHLLALMVWNYLVNFEPFSLDGGFILKFSLLFFFWGGVGAAGAGNFRFSHIYHTIVSLPLFFHNCRLAVD